MKNAFVKEILDWALHIGIAVVVGLLIVTFLAQIMFVDGASMEPTLANGNILLIDKLSPRLGHITYGDIVTVKDVDLGLERKRIIKRVIAVENDTIEIKDGKVYVNGNLKSENYIKGDITQAVNPKYSKLTVPQGYIYVMGDNRMDSKDSRSIGPVDLKKVDGKAIFRLYPFNLAGKIHGR